MLEAVQVLGSKGAAACVAHQTTGRGRAWRIKAPVGLGWVGEGRGGEHASVGRREGTGWGSWGVRDLTREVGKQQRQREQDEAASRRLLLVLSTRLRLVWGKRADQQLLVFWIGLARTPSSVEIGVEIIGRWPLASLIVPRRGSQRDGRATAGKLKKNAASLLFLSNSGYLLLLGNC